MNQRIFLDFSACNKIESILVALIVLFTITGNNSLISLCFALSFIVMFTYLAQQGGDKDFWKGPVLLVAISVINVLINGMVSKDAELSFDYFKKLIMFSAFVFTLYKSVDDQVSPETIDIILKLPCIEGIMLVLSYYLLGNSDVQAGGITLNFTNSNFTGMWLFHISVYSFLLCIRENISWVKRVIIIVFLALEIYLLFKTGARSCWISIVLFAVLCLIGKIVCKKLIINPIVLAIVVVSPIVIVLLYSSLLNSAWFVNLFSFMISSGKTLNSRLLVWTPAIELLKKNAIFGNYEAIEGGIGVIRTQQLHNMHLDVLCSYGIVPFVLFLMLLFHVCKKVGEKADNYFSYCAFCGFLCVIVQGIFEAGIVAGAMGLNLLTTGLVLLAMNSPSDKIPMYELDMEERQILSDS